MRRHFVSRFLESDDRLELMTLAGRYDERVGVTVDASGQPVLAARDTSQATAPDMTLLSTTKSFDTDTRQAPSPDTPPEPDRFGLKTAASMDTDTRGQRDLM